MKPFIEWSDALIIGIKQIDDQHKGLVAIANEISEGFSSGWEQDARDKTLAKLVEHAVIHFATEESLMNVSSYPEEIAHKEHHQDLIKMIRLQVKKYQDSPEESGRELLFFVKRWLVEHILKDDKMMGEYFLRTGVAKVAKEKRSLFGKLKNWLSLGHNALLASGALR